MSEPGASAKPSAPRPADLLRMLGQLRRGSAADTPLGLLTAFRELSRTPGGAPGSPLTAKDVEGSQTYRSLATPNIHLGDPAFDFELPRLDPARAHERRSGETVRLSAHRQVSPVALIFGSYT